MITPMSKPVQRGHVTSRMGMGGFLVALLILAACGASPSTTGGTAPTATTAPSPTVAASPIPAQAGYPIKVFFSKTPDSENNLNAVFSVTRMSPTAQVETYAVQLLIAGPTPEERAAGYYSELNSLLNGPSLCPSVGPVGGPDFTLTLNAPNGDRHLEVLPRDAVAWHRGRRARDGRTPGNPDTIQHHQADSRSQYPG